MRIKLIITAIAIALIFGIAQSACAGEKSIGLRGGYSTRHSTPVAGLVFQYQFSKHFEVSPSIDYFIRNKGADALALNADVHFPFAIAPASRTGIYPLAGINYTSWNHHIGAIDTDDVSTRLNRLGLNLGGGLRLYATPTLKLSLEAKATILKQCTTGTFTLSIGYVF